MEKTINNSDNNIDDSDSQNKKKLGEIKNNYLLKKEK